MGNVADNAGSWLVATPGGPRVELHVGREVTPNGVQWHTSTGIGEHLTQAEWATLCADAVDSGITDAAWRTTLAGYSPAWLARAEARAVAVGRPSTAVVTALRATCRRWHGYQLPPL